MAISAFVVPFFGKTVVRIVVSTFGIFLGPVLAIFTMGVFLPWTNSMGVMLGAMIGASMASWVCIGGLIYLPNHDLEQILPTNTSGCFHNGYNSSYQLNYTTTVVTTTEQLLSSPLEDTVYSISYLYHSMIGYFVSILFGLLISFISGANKPSESDPRLFVPLFDNKRLPEKLRNFFRFGVPELKEQHEANDAEEQHLSMDLKDTDLF
uniref:Sodium-dependent multivitamin transporter n=1 Tax=Ciona savignyi TaxID=51511 RepID=H2Z777_CIOSA